MIHKNPDDRPIDPVFVAQEVVRLDDLVDRFSAAMKARLREKAEAGWTGWDDPVSAQEIYTSMLAQGAGVPMAFGQEVDIANLSMMLWRFNHPGNTG